jgi:hypothetical protein
MVLTPVRVRPFGCQPPGRFNIFGLAAFVALLDINPVSRPVVDAQVTDALPHPPDIASMTIGKPVKPRRYHHSRPIIPQLHPPFAERLGLLKLKGHVAICSL